VFGREARLPIDVITGNENNLCPETELNKAAYVRMLEEKLFEIHEFAREISKKSSLRQKSYFNPNVGEVNYDIGDLVRRSQTKVAKGTKLKLARKWTGPWILENRLSDVLYQIRHSSQSKPVVVHADNLKPYKGSKRPTLQNTEYTSSETPGACFTKELTITIKFYPVHYSLIRTNLKTILIVLKRI
jgi:hypothetical protein